MNIVLLAPFILYLIACLYIAYRADKSNKGGDNFSGEFYVGGRNMGTFALAFGFAATAASAGTFVGTPGLAYKFGLVGAMIAVSEVTIGYLPLGVLARRYNHIARKLKAVTLADILEARYESSAVVLLSSLIIIIFYIPYMISQFMAGGRVLQAFIGIPYAWAVVIFGSVVFIYTAIGGYKAIVWTDILQGSIMLFGIVAIIFALAGTSEGFAGLTTALANEDLNLVTLPGVSNFLPVTMIISYWLLWPVLAIGQPAQLVHLMTFKDGKTLNKAMILGTVIFGLNYAFGFPFYGTFARVITPGLSAPDLALPTLVLKLLPPALAGLVIAAPFAAIMSTVDSMILVTTGTIIQNIYRKFINPNATEKQIKNLIKFVPIVIGIIVIIFSIRPVHLLELIVIFSWGGLGSAFFAPIVFGFFWRKANKYGAIAAIVGGTLGNITLYYLKPNYLGINTSIWSWLFAIILIVVVSSVTQAPSQNVIKKFFAADDTSCTGEETA